MKYPEYVLLIVRSSSILLLGSNGANPLRAKYDRIFRLGTMDRFWADLDCRFCVELLFEEATQIFAMQ